MTGFVWDHFYPTVPMSTYLVAAAVGDYIRINASEAVDAKWSFNLYVRRSAVDQTKYYKNIHKIENLHLPSTFSLGMLRR